MRPPALALFGRVDCQHVANMANKLLGKTPSKKTLDNARKSLTITSSQIRDATLKGVFMLNFLEVALRAIAFLVCCAVAVACMLQYFDVLIK